jgi:hypothetical protein
MGILTLVGFGLFFIVGILVGVVVENQHQEDKRKEERIRYWRWSVQKESIEDQMKQDGWTL